MRVAPRRTVRHPEVMTDETIIRRADRDDVAAAAALRWEWIVRGKGARPVGTEAEFVADTVAWAERHAETHSCYVAELDGEIVGMAWLAFAARVPSPRAVDRRNADVQSVYVSPSVRGHGVGGLLIDTLIDTAREAGAERITVHSSAEAVRVYERHGFAIEPLLLERELTTP